MQPHSDESPKPARLEARITPEQKALFQKAAALSNLTLTDFVIYAVQEQAYEVLRRHEIIELSERDARIFVEAILNLPEPNDRLKAAAKRYFDAKPAEA